MSLMTIEYSRARARAILCRWQETCVIETLLSEQLEEVRVCRGRAARSAPSGWKRQYVTIGNLCYVCSIFPPVSAISADRSHRRESRNTRPAICDFHQSDIEFHSRFPSKRGYDTNRSLSFSFKPYSLLTARSRRRGAQSKRRNDLGSSVDTRLSIKRGESRFIRRERPTLDS